MKTFLTLWAVCLTASISFAAKGEGQRKGPPEGGPRPSPEEFFKRLDTDKDGAISKEEFLASPRSQKDPAKAEKRFEQLDKNKDGKIDKSEFAAGGRDRKGGPKGPGGPEGAGSKEKEGDKRPENK